MMQLHGPCMEEGKTSWTPCMHLAHLSDPMAPSWSQVINELMDDHPVGGVKLKEVLGHTPRQVVCGAILGVCVGLFFPC